MVPIGNALDLNGEYRLQNKDDEFLEVMKKGRKCMRSLLLDWRQYQWKLICLMLQMAQTYYQDLDNADSPFSSEEDDGVGRKEKKEKAIPQIQPKQIKRKSGFGIRTIVQDKKQLVGAFKNYKIYKGYVRRLTKSERKDLDQFSQQRNVSGSCGYQNFGGKHLGKSGNYLNLKKK